MLAVLLGLAGGIAAEAQDKKDILPGVSVENFTMNRNGKFLTVEMDVDMSELQVPANRAVVLTPRLVNGSDSLDLPAIGVYGRRRYYYYIRNGIGTISGEKEQAYCKSQKPDHVAYGNSVDYQDWMNGATLKFHRSDYGCCEEMVAQYDGLLGLHEEAVPEVIPEKFIPELIFVQPEAELVKVRSLSGSAFIDFPVDQTVIYPDYRRNTVELGKIQATIDTVRNDRDVTITTVWLKGFASPESPYKHNTDLAIGRTAALKKHINQLYHFPEGVIRTEYEPEDWEGLRRYVDRSNLEHREQILAMIDTDMDPDAKEAKIKRTYPADYRFLLQNCYPALRHTDYRIDYSIRAFSDVEEIERIMAERPQNLSLNEFYLVARKYEPGSAEFTNVFETAVRLYPADPIANLNAANAAISRGNLETAKRYLAKAGDSAEAFYTRGVLAYYREDYDSARSYMNRAKEMGLQQAAAALEDLDKQTK